MNSQKNLIAQKNPINVSIESLNLPESDTGSPEYQCVALTRRINHLIDHFAVHKKDKHSKVGLIAMVERRKKFLSYLKKVSVERYQKLIAALGMRK